MPKNRKTRKEKQRTEQRKKEGEMFQIKEEWLKTGTKKEKEAVVLSKTDRRFLRADLTKTFLLSMLVLALELALWQYLLRH